MWHDSCNSTYRLRYWNYKSQIIRYIEWAFVATVLTVYGIETTQRPNTVPSSISSCNSTYRLRYWNIHQMLLISYLYSLQQYLPFTVLKRIKCHWLDLHICCNSTYRLRYWNWKGIRWAWSSSISKSCNSTYRLRYWNYKLIDHVLLLLNVATVLTVYGIETNAQYHYLPLL